MLMVHCRIFQVPSSVTFSGVLPINQTVKLNLECASRIPIWNLLLCLVSGSNGLIGRFNKTAHLDTLGHHASLVVYHVEDRISKFWSVIDMSRSGPLRKASAQFDTQSDRFVVLRHALKLSLFLHIAQNIASTLRYNNKFEPQDSWMLVHVGFDKLRMSQSGMVEQTSFTANISGRLSKSTRQALRCSSFGFWVMRISWYYHTLTSMLKTFNT